MPWLAPVTIATLPLRFNSMMLPSCDSSRSVAQPSSGLDVLRVATRCNQEGSAVTRKKIVSSALTVPLFLAGMTLLVAAKKPPPTSFEGLVVKVDGMVVLLSAADEKHFKPVSVETDSRTEVLMDGKAAKLDDLKPGERVIVSPPQGKAARIEQKPARRGKAPESGLLDGAIVSADPSRIVFLSPMSSGEISRIEAATSDRTVVMIDGKTAAAADLKAGQYVVIAFTGGNVRRVVVQSATAE
jgi:hypothetical protein